MEIINIVASGVDGPAYLALIAIISAVVGYFIKRDSRDTEKQEKLQEAHTSALIQIAEATAKSNQIQEESVKQREEANRQSAYLRESLQHYAEMNRLNLEESKKSREDSAKTRELIVSLSKYFVNMNGDLEAVAINKKKVAEEFKKAKEK